MVKKSIRCWESGTYSIYDVENKLHEAKLLMLDISKAISDLNWRPVLTAQEAIDRTILWYKSYYEGESATKLIKGDIEYYYERRNV
jgi:CDP-glucose 4,6-dehydratase